MDVFTKEQRSCCMSKIRGKNTKPELKLRRSLWSIGLRYRIHYELLGRPDVVFVRAKVAIFVDGCFWHGCPEHGRRPKTNIKFWNSKIQKNVDRDLRNTSELRKTGWKVLRFWEHEIKEDVSKLIRKIVSALS